MYDDTRGYQGDDNSICVIRVVNQYRSEKTAMSENQMLIIVVVTAIFLFTLLPSKPVGIVQRYEDIAYYMNASAQLEITYFKDKKTEECSYLMKAVVDDNSVGMSGWFSAASLISCDEIPKKESGDGKN